MDQVATVLSTCTKDGGDQALPFQTPADYLLSIPDLRDSPLQTREYSFLTNPRVTPLLVMESVPTFLNSW